HITMANGVLLGGHVVIEEGVGLGGMCGIHHFVTIGRHAFVGALSRVLMDAPPYLISDGSRGRVRAVNRVGLKRGGFSDEQIAWLKEAQRLLFFEGLGAEDAFGRLSRRGEIPPEGHVLFQFLERREQGNLGRANQP
ncbi:MAG: acyl-ACP--UDP-N-acetylglucosamine O-acyltransferase, partial [Planctomycetota bacterium]